MGPAREALVAEAAEHEGLHGGAGLAVAFGVPVATVWTRLHHARRRMMAGPTEGGR